MGEWRSYVEGPRWARFDIAIKNAAHARGLTATVERDTTLLSEHVRFVIVGDAAMIENLQVSMNQAIEAWNA